MNSRYGDHTCSTAKILAQIGLLVLLLQPVHALSQTNDYEWRVSAILVSPIVAGGVNSRIYRVYVDTPLVLSVRVYQVRGWPVGRGNGLQLKIRSFSESGDSPRDIESKSILGFGAGASRNFNFNLTSFWSPRQVVLAACLTGLKDDKWPAPDVCGLKITITVIDAPGQSTKRPAAQTLNNCTGGRTKNSQGRCICPSGTFWNPNPGFKRCYTCAAGRVWDRSKRRCVIQ